MRSVRLIFGASSLLIFAACTFGNGSSSGAFSAPAGGLSSMDFLKNDGASKHISHIIIVVQENRTFENFFAGYPGANAPTSGCGKPPKGEAVPRRISRASTSGCPSGDQVIPLHQITFEKGPNLSHEYESSIIDWDNGKMDGFTHFGLHHDDAGYAYVEQSEVSTYWSMAQQYVLSDAMFPTEFGPSWTAHLTLVAGTDNLNNRNNLALADFADARSNCGAPKGTKTTTVNIKRIIKPSSGPYPCLNQFNTMAQALDNASVSWKYYVAQNYKAFIWSPYGSIQYVHNGPDWTNNIIQPETTVLTDIQNGTLPQVSWVTPNRLDSDHPNSHNDSGPSWVASIVNTLGQSQYWNSSAVIVLWDDYGGFYDNAPPPQLDFRGLGIRVPCLIISPYAKSNYVDHTQYEFGSILKFIEEVFPNVKRLGRTKEGYTDTRANSLDNAFNFTQAPRAFQRIKQKYPVSHFLRGMPVNEPPDKD